MHDRYPDPSPDVDRRELAGPAGSWPAGDGGVTAGHPGRRRPDARRPRRCTDHGAAAGSTPPTLASVVASVAVHILPNIHGLPTGADLDRLVERTARRVYTAGLTDPDLHGLDVPSWRTVITTRVGLALAFP